MRVNDGYVLALACFITRSFHPDFQTPAGFDSASDSNGLLHHHAGVSGGRPETIFTTLLRDQGKGLGFSIAGGKGADPFVEDSDSVFISKIAEAGPAARDGKLLVGDRLLQINGVDVSEAEHMKVVELLTGLERFVRLCVERNSLPATNGHSSTTNLFNQPSLSSLADGNQPGKSPKVFGLPKPYTGLYSASSYMANRPSYMRSREPGQYTITSTSSSPGSGTGSNTTSYSKLPGVTAGVPGSSDRKSFGTLPGSRTLPEIPRSSSSTSTSLPRKSTSEDHSSALVNPGESERSLADPDSAVQALISRLPPAPTKPGLSTETVTRTSYTETTVRRVTDNKVGRAKPPPASAVEVSVAHMRKRFTNSKKTH